MEKIVDDTAPNLVVMAYLSMPWTSVQPQLVNENVPIPAENAFLTLYRKQFGDK